MSNLPTENEPDQWHRYFAVACNNRAWELATRERCAEDDLEMLSAAHASFHHWEAIGIELNKMRALMLLAEVHSLLGYGQSALSYALEIQRYFLNKETADWEIALTKTIYAHAAFTAGEVELFTQAYPEAVEALEAIADSQDRDIVQKTFNQVPVP